MPSLNISLRLRLVRADDFAGEVVPGIARVLAVIAGPEAAWDFPTERSSYVSGDELRRPIDALKAGEIEAVIAADRFFLDALT